MASTYATNTGLELIRNGEQSGTWGTTTNNNLNIIDRLTNGVVSISLGGLSTYTLTTGDGSLSDGQFKVLVFTGGLPGSPNPACTVTIAPNTNQHVYMIYNKTDGAVTITQGGGGNVVIPALVGDAGVNIVFCDGVGSGSKVTSLTDNIASNAIKITGGVITGITDLAVVDGGTGAGNASSARANLGLVIGSGASGDIQPYDANLKAFVDALTLPSSDGATGQAMTTNGSGTLAFTTIATAARAYTFSVLF
mgnify:CR=1 FL=1|tara:strand:- start:526 stop:1278 length:753 start_codon:yes stop_codon:yes gene_type:complete